jgi:hypothetical protein
MSLLLALQGPAGLQAVRFDSAADTLVMPSAALPSGSGGWTVAGWFRLVNDRNAVTTLWSLDGVFSSSWHSLRTDVTGTSLRLNQSGTDVLTIASLTVGTWYFVAVRKDASGNVKAYVGTEAGGVLTTVTGSVTNINPYSGDGYVGGNAYGDWLDGRGWGLRLWDVDLSDAEVDAEFTASSRARTANNRAQWLLDTVPPTADSSGNSRTLTNTGGAWALEAGPTLPTGAGATVMPAAVGVLTGTTAPVLLTSVSPATTGVLTGAQAPTLAVPLAVAATGVLTGVQTASLVAGLAVGTAGVLTGTQTPTTEGRVFVSALGVVTGLNAPSVSASGSVSPAAVGVLTGTQAPSLAGVVAVPGVGVLTGTQSVSAAASLAVTPTGVLTGATSTTLRSSVSPAGVGVLTGLPAPDVLAGTPPAFYIYPGQGWATAILVSQSVRATLLTSAQASVVLSSSTGARAAHASSPLARAEKLDS